MRTRAQIEELIRDFEGFAEFVVGEGIEEDPLPRIDLLSTSLLRILIYIPPSPLSQLVH